MRKLKSVFFLILFLSVRMMVYGQSTSVASGMWTDPTVWSTNPVLPAAKQAITISTGTTINGTPAGTSYALTISGTLIFNGDFINNSGGITIQDGGILIIKGDLSTRSQITINGTGKMFVTGDLTQTGGNIQLNNIGILVVGGIFTEGSQTTAANNSSTILVIGDYVVNGNLSRNADAEIAVLGVSGAGCPGCVGSIAPTDPAWLFYLNGNPNLWIGTTDTAWTNIANWTTSVVPLSLADVQFASVSNNGQEASNNLVLDADRTIGNLLNLSSKSLVVSPGTCLTVNGTITTSNNPSQIYIQSSATGPGGSLIFHNAADSPVQATVDMYSLATWNLDNPAGEKYKWQYFGIPVRALSSAYPTFDGAYVREMHENDSPEHWNQLSNTSGLTSFAGYEVTQAAEKTYVFQGALENSDYDVTMPFTSTAAFPGQTLVGNPYTAAIDITQMVFGSQMLATVYLYNTGSKNDWITNGQTPADSTGTLAGQYTAVPFALAGLETLPRQIPSMQAFLVRAKSSSANATLKIPYSTASTIVKNTTAQRVRASRQVADALIPCTRMDVKGSRFSDRMWIFTVPACSHAFDNGYDGEKVMGSSVAPQLFAMEEDGDYQVNAVDDLNNTYLGFQPGADSLYTLTFTHQNYEVQPLRIYLVDSLTGTTTNITLSGSTYTFQSLPGSPLLKRFKLITSSILDTNLSDANNTDPRVLVFSSQNAVSVDNTSEEAGTLTLYDVTGRFVKQYSFQDHAITTFHPALSPGVYVARAVTRTLKTTHQVMLK